MEVEFQQLWGKFLKKCFSWEVEEISLFYMAVDTDI